MTMFSTWIPFLSSGDKENTSVTRSEKRTRGKIDETKSFRRALLQLIITKSQSITAFIDPARARAHSESPTIHEELPPSPLSPIYPPSLLSPMSPRGYCIPDYPERPWSPSSAGNLNSPVHYVCQTCSSPYITILSDPEREEREAYLSPSFARWPRSPPIPPAPVADVMDNVKIEIVRDVATGTGADTTKTSARGMLDVPLVGKPDDLVRYYPNDYDLFTRRLHSMVKRKSSIVAARRRDNARRRRQTATTLDATSTPISTPTPTPTIPTARDSDSNITETV